MYTKSTPGLFFFGSKMTGIEVSEAALMNIRRSRSAFLTAVALILVLGASRPATQAGPTPDNLEARTWFQDAKFGLFIHWGVYSVLGEASGS